MQQQQWIYVEAFGQLLAAKMLGPELESWPQLGVRVPAQVTLILLKCLCGDLIRDACLEVLSSDSVTACSRFGRGS